MWGRITFILICLSFIHANAGYPGFATDKYCKKPKYSAKNSDPLNCKHDPCEAWNFERSVRCRSCIRFKEEITKCGVLREMTQFENKKFQESQKGKSRKDKKKVTSYNNCRLSTGNLFYEMRAVQQNCRDFPKGGKAADKELTKFIRKITCLPKTDIKKGEPTREDEDRARKESEECIKSHLAQYKNIYLPHADKMKSIKDRYDQGAPNKPQTLPTTRTQN